MSTKLQAEAPLIIMEGVEKWYGGFHALKAIDLQVKSGEKIVLCGPSGSGKSTLIRCINHLEPIQKGRITVDGTALDHSPARSIPCGVKSEWSFRASISFRT